MRLGGSAQPSGALGLRVIRGDGSIEVVSAIEPPGLRWPNTLKLADVIEHGLPQKGLPEAVNEWRRLNQRHLNRRMRKYLPAKGLRLPMMYGALFLEVCRGDGRREELGLASLGVVTTAGVGFIVDAFQNLTELENMRFHGFGTGAGAEAVGDTALATELTTQYAVDNTRPTGSQTENGANVFRTVGTLDPDANVGITEHGIFSQAATGGGVLLDRSLFAVVNLDGAGGDTLEATYDFTLTAGS
jgi:hypothetical protein